MAYIDFEMVRSVKRWFSDFAVHREERRTERHLNSLPEHLLKDIGWPDAYAERLAQRSSMNVEDAGARGTSAARHPSQADWPKRYDVLKTRKSSALESGC